MFNFKSRSSKGGGGSAALPAAAAFVGSKKERSVHAAAATAESRVAAAAYSWMPGALAASAVGSTAIVSVSNGSLAGAATDLLDAMLVEGMEEPAGAATDLLDALNSECIEELSGPATIVLGDNGGCAAVESDLHGTFYSRDVFSSIVSGSMVPIRGFDSNSSHHPIHACAHSRLDLCGVGSGVGVGLGACSGVLCGVLPGVADDVDDACMDGTALDGIRVASNSLIQSFTEYHDNSCARLTALQNSRVGRGPQVGGGTKRATTGSLRQVRLSDGKKTFFFPAAVKKVA